MLTLLKKVKSRRRGGRRHPSHPLLRAHKNPSALHRLHRRATAAMTTPDEGIYIREASWGESEIEEAMEEAVRELVRQMDEDGCLQKLLCHLQESLSDPEAPEDSLDGLFPAEAPECTQQFPACPLTAAQLTEVLAQMGPLYNAV